MKNLLVIFTFLISANLNISAQGNKNFIDKPYIEVTGSAKISLVPDEIYISIQINEVEGKGKVIVEDLEKKMIETLKKIGVDIRNELSVIDFSSNFKNHWLKRPGIKNNKRYQLKVNSGQMAGKVFYELENLGISNLNIIKTDHSEIEEYKQRVKVEAIKAARVKADNLTTAIGQKAGKAIFIQEQNYRPYRNAKVANASFMASPEGLGKEIANIDFEFIELEYDIFVRFALE